MKAFKPLDNWTPLIYLGKAMYLWVNIIYCLGLITPCPQASVFVLFHQESLVLPLPSHLLWVSTSHSVWTFSIDQVSENWFFGFTLAWVSDASWKTQLGHSLWLFKSCPALCDPMNCSTPSFPVLHYLLRLLKLMSVELIMPFNHPRSPPSPPALNLSQHQGHSFRCLNYYEQYFVKKRMNIIWGCL